VLSFPRISSDTPMLVYTRGGINLREEMVYIYERDDFSYWC
jgi:hypothetical protein